MPLALHWKLVKCNQKEKFWQEIEDAFFFFFYPLEEGGAGIFLVFFLW